MNVSLETKGKIVKSIVLCLGIVLVFLIAFFIIKIYTTEYTVTFMNEDNFAGVFWWDWPTYVYNTKEEAIKGHNEIRKGREDAWAEVVSNENKMYAKDIILERKPL